MANRVKGIVVEIGGDTTGLNKALQGTNSQIQKTQQALKDVERLLKMDPGNTKLLEQKQRLLAQSIESTEEKLRTLNKANDQVKDNVKNYDAWKAAFDPIQEEIDQTSQKLKKLTEQQKQMEEAGDVGANYDKVCDDIEQTTRKLEELKKKAKEVSDSFGNPISQDQYDALQREIIETEQKLDSLRQSAEQNMKAIANSVDPAKQKLQELGKTAEAVKAKADGVANAFRPVTTAIMGLATAAVATVPATEELREDLSKLDANARENKVDIEAAREAWKAFAVQSGETDSAVEGVSNLLQAGFTESNLQKAVEGLAGAAQRFPDTLKIESLADSLQETLASGEATGQFSELLSRLGLDAEQFSTNLAACTSEAEKQNLVLQTLASAGLNDSYNAWKQNNEEMLANKEANLEFQTSMAELAEAILPVVTTVTSAMADFVSWFANLPGPVQAAIAVLLLFVASISPIASTISGVSTIIAKLATVDFPGLGTAISTISTTVLPGLQTAFTTVCTFIASNPIVLLIAAIVGLVALITTKGEEIKNVIQGIDDFLQGVFVTDWTNVFGPVLGGVLNNFCAKVKAVWDYVREVLVGLIDFIQGVFTGNWEQAWNGIERIFTAVSNVIIDGANMIIDWLNDIINMVNEFTGWSIETIDRLKRLTKDEESGPRTHSGGGGKIPDPVSTAPVYSDAWPYQILPPTGITAQELLELHTASTSNNFTNNLGGINMTINAAPGQDVQELAGLVVDELTQSYLREEAALG